MSEDYHLIRLDLPALTALADGRAEEAAALLGTPLSAFIAREAWLWRIRRDQVLHDPGALEWIARPARALRGRDAGVVVGHIGCHGPPDAEGRVEIAYAVDPAYRRRGHARRLLAQELHRLHDDVRVRVVRASISPGNTASLATIAGFGFDRVGEQWDEEDGLEWLFEVSATSHARAAPQ